MNNILNNKNENSTACRFQQNWKKHHSWFISNFAVDVFFLTTHIYNICEQWAGKSLLLNSPLGQGFQIVGPDSFWVAYNSLGLQNIISALKFWRGGSPACSSGDRMSHLNMCWVTTWAMIWTSLKSIALCYSKLFGLCW